MVIAAVVVLSSRKEDGCRIALLHINPEYHQKEANIEKNCEMAAVAFENSADIVLTSEMATDEYFLSEEDVVSYIGIKDMENEFSSISETARKYKGYICLRFPEIDSDGSMYNCAVLFGREGKVVLHECKRTIPD